MGHYLTDRTQLDRMFGSDNVTRNADYNNNGSAGEITASIDDAINQAEEHVDDRFRGSRYAVPLSPINTTVMRWVARLAYVELYRGRGLRDADDKTAGKMTALVDQVNKEIDQYLADIKSGPWGTSLPPSSTAPSVIDANGRALGTSSSYPGSNPDQRGSSWPTTPINRG